MNMPGMGGLAACREIRRDSDVAIVMLTVRNSEEGRVTTLPPVPAIQHTGLRLAPYRCRVKIGKHGADHARDPDPLWYLWSVETRSNAQGCDSMREWRCHFRFSQGPLLYVTTASL